MSDSELELGIRDLIECERYEEAYGLLIPLANRGSKYATFALGWMHENGAFVEQSVELARSHYERAIALGSVAAYLWLGRSFVVAGQKSEARAIFEKGAELGDLGCMNEFGAMVYAGEGGPVNAAVGIAWLERAANQGHFFAKRKLLSIASKNSRSIITRFVVFLEIIVLGMRGALESVKDKWSERLR